MPNPPIGGADGQFDYMAADIGGTGATGTTLGQGFLSFSTALDDAAETRLRIVVNANDLNVEWAFDSLMVTGDLADITPPTLDSFTREVPATSPTNADSLTFRASFDEAVVNVGTDDFVANGSTALVTTVAQINASTYDVTISGGDLAGLNGLVGLDLAPGQDIEDTAGNPLPNVEPATDELYLLDNVSPVLTAFARNTPATSPTNADTLIFDITFDEDVVNVNEADFVINGTTATGSLSGSGSAYQLMLSGGDLAGLNGTVSLDLSGTHDIEDLAGNELPNGEPATDEDYVLDNVSPVLTAFARNTPASSPTNADVLIFDITFDEDVVNVNEADFVINGTTANGNLSGSGSAYLLTLSGGDLAGLNGTVSLDLSGTQDIEDLAGNALPNGEPATDEDYVLDNIAPTLDSIVRLNPSTSPTNADALTFQTTFSEAVVNVGTDDFVANGSTALVTLVAQVNASTYDVTISGGDLAGLNGLVGLDLSPGQDIEDPAGNAVPNVEPATDELYLLDNIAPTLLRFERLNPPVSPTSADVLVFQATFDEDVANVDINDFVPNGTTANVSSVSMVSGDVYDITVSGGDLPGLNGTVGLDLAGGQDIEDLAGNPLPPGEPAIDDTYDVVNVTAAPEFLVNDFTSNFQVTYAETRNVAANVAGDMVIAFAGRGNGDSQGIYARRYDATNTPLGPSFLVNQTTGSNQRYPSVAVGAGGEFVIVWSGSGVGDSNGVYFRLYDDSGTPLTGEVRVNETTRSDQFKPVVAKAPNGDFIVTWTGKGTGDMNTGVLRAAGTTSTALR